MKNKKLAVIVIAVVAVIAVATGILIALNINKKDTSSEVLDESTSLPESSVVSLPDSVPDAPTSLPDLEEFDLENDPKTAYDDGAFFNYLLDFSVYFNEAFATEAEFNQLYAGSWLPMGFVANNVYAFDMGQGVEYDRLENGQVLIPVSRMEEGSEQVLGFRFDFSRLAGGEDLLHTGEDGTQYFVLPDGWDMLSAPYIDLGSVEATIEGDVITAEGTLYYASLDDEGELYGSYRYTFRYMESNEITPYQLVSIQAI